MGKLPETQTLRSKSRLQPKAAVSGLGFEDLRLTSGRPTKTGSLLGQMHVFHVYICLSVLWLPKLLSVERSGSHNRRVQSPERSGV